MQVTNGSVTATQAYTITIGASAVCTLSVSDFETDLSNGQIVVSSIIPNVGSSTASFVLTNKTHCTAPISLSSYKVLVTPDLSGWLSTQQLFDVTSSLAVAPSSTQTFTVKTANCMTQVDAWYGQAPATLLDSNPYWYPNVPFVLAWAFTNSGNLCGATSAPSADLSLTKTVDSHSPQTGATVNYTVTVSALGPATSTGVTASDVLPAGLAFVSASSSKGSYASSTGTWTIGDMSASSTATLNIAATVTASAGAQVTNAATVSESSSSTDSNPGNNTASTTITVAPATAATVIATKIVCPATASLPDLSASGQTITSSTASAFLSAHPECRLTSGWDFQWGYSTVTDPGGNFIGEAPSSTGWHTFGPTGQNGLASVLISDLQNTPNLWVREVLQSGYLSFSYPPINSTTSAEMFCHRDVLNYDNYDRVDGPVAGGTYYCVAWNVSLATSTPSADLSITKTVDNHSPQTGATVNYTVTVSALGPATSTGVVASDTLPSGLTFVNATATKGSYASSTGSWTIGDMGASSTATLQIAATVNASSGTQITNIAVASESASSTDANPSNNTASTTLTVVPNDCAGGCGPSGNATGTLTVAVAGLQSGATSTLMVFQSTYAPAVATSVGNGTLPFVIKVNNTYAVTATTTAPGYTVVTSAGCAGTFSTSTTCAVTFSLVSADLSVTKTVDSHSPQTGATVNYTVTVSALGPATSTGVVASDTLPSGLTFVSATATKGSYASSTGLWTIGDMGASSTATLNIAATVTASAGAQVVNTATVSESSSSTDSNPGNNTASTTITVAGGGTTVYADISVTKSVDNANPAAGSTVRYLVTATALGPAASTFVDVHDLLPAGLSLLNATTSQGLYNLGTGDWNIGTLASNATATLVMAVTIDGRMGGQTIVNTATISELSSLIDNPANNSSSVSIAVQSSSTPFLANLGVTKTVDNPHPNTGDVVHYLITVSDPGPASSTNIVATDTLPFNLTFVNATASQGTYASTTGTWLVGNMQVSSTATLAIAAVVNASSGTTIVNTVNVEGNPDPSASATLTVVGGCSIVTNCANLSVAKSVDNAAPQSGSTVRYTVTVSALGPATSTGVTATEAMPSGVVFQNATASQGSYAASTGTWTIGDMSANSVATLQIAVTVSASAGTSVTNFATVGESASSTNQNPSNSASSTFTVATPPCTINCGTVVSTVVGVGGGGGGIYQNFNLLIDGGAPTTATTSATLTLTATGATQMRLSNDPSFATSTLLSGSVTTGWIPFQGTYPWTLTSGVGEKTVYARFGNNGSQTGSSQAAIQLMGSPSVGQVLGASTSCGLYLNDYIRLGWNNNPNEVRKLQTFMNGNMGTTLPITGIYDQQDFNAVEQFQIKYGSQVLAPWVPLGLLNQTTPTGFVYQTTKWWINRLYCEALNIPQPYLQVYQGQ
jgi:uncharacterized repeat protein (TIGR01451 family)